VDGIHFVVEHQKVSPLGREEDFFGARHQLFAK
jgi:hypothetical protein